MKSICILLLIVLIGCHSRQLKIEDLKFGDFERESIAKNRIDTTYIVAKNPTMKWKFGELLGSSIDDTTQYLNWKFMDAGFVTYDCLGRTISDQSMRWRDYRYFYDSLGLLDSIVYRDWDVMPKYGSTYEFYPDSLVLLQKWIQGGSVHHVCRFKFNGEGELVEQYDNDDENHSSERHTYRRFEYQNGKMKFTSENKYKNGQLEFESKTQLYYSNLSRLDSTISDIKSKEEGSYKMITYYDTSGLKKRAILMDTMTILYRHIQRKW